MEARVCDAALGGIQYMLAARLLGFGFELWHGIRLMA
jgi:hypothetical protein